MFFWQGTILMVFRWFLVQATSGSIVAQNQANSAMVTWLPVGQLLGLMVFQWFLGQRQPSGLIVFYGCPLLVKRCDVHLLLLKSTSNEWNSELFDRMGKRSKLLSGFARCPDVQILPLLYCWCLPLPHTNLGFYIVPDISNLVFFPMLLCCVVMCCCFVLMCLWPLVVCSSQIWLFCRPIGAALKGGRRKSATRCGGRVLWDAKSYRHTWATKVRKGFKRCFKGKNIAANIA